MGDDLEARHVYSVSGSFIAVQLETQFASHFARATHGFMSHSSNRGLNKTKTSRFDDTLGPGARFELSLRILDMEINGVFADVQDGPDRPG